MTDCMKEYFEGLDKAIEGIPLPDNENKDDE